MHQRHLTAARGTVFAYMDDRYRIGYGTTGFETFHLDIPNALRGHVATLKFTASSTVYLDDVFFKSEHLLFGNPSEARYTPEAPDTYKTNYLLEKPQYTVSYNAQNLDRIPNWVSWQLNQSWLGTQNKRYNFVPDETLPFTPRVMDDEYKNCGDAWYAYDKGHMATSEYRSRSDKDVISTYLMSNILPQHARNNQFNTAWRNLEDFCKDDLVRSEGKELYIIAGGYGSLGTIPPGYIDRVNVPEYTWKIILVLDRPGQGISDVRTSTDVIAVITPNFGEPDAFPHTVNLPENGKTITIDSLTEWQDWQNWRVDVNYLEQLTGYDFLSNIPEEIQNVIEARDTNPTFTSP